MNTSDPVYIVRATLGKGPCIEQQLIDAVAFHGGLTRAWAAVATANAIVTLITGQVVEMFHPGPPRAYRLGASQKMEVQADRERKAKEATTKRTRAEAPLDRLIRLAKAKQAEAREREWEASEVPRTGEASA